MCFDRPEEDRFAAYLGCLTGHPGPAFRGRDAMPDMARRHYAGHLGGQTRHPDGLRAILTGVLGLPVRIREFVGHWLVLPPDCRLRLGSSPETGALGRTATVGGRVWDHQSKLRIRVGPLSLAEYEGLLPGGAALDRLVASVRDYLGDALDWDIELVLKEREVPRLKLGGGVRLGWTTWSTSGGLGRDGDDLKLAPFRRLGGPAEKTLSG